MTSDEKLKQAIHEAFLSSAKAMGDNLRNITWFGRNLKPKDTGHE